MHVKFNLKKEYIFEVVKIATTFWALSITKLQFISSKMICLIFFWHFPSMSNVDFFHVSCRETPCIMRNIETKTILELYDRCIIPSFLNNAHSGKSRPESVILIRPPRLPAAAMQPPEGVSRKAYLGRTLESAMRPPRGRLICLDISRSDFKIESDSGVWLRCTLHTSFELMQRFMLRDALQNPHAFRVSFWASKQQTLYRERKRNKYWQVWLLLVLRAVFDGNRERVCWFESKKTYYDMFRWYFLLKRKEIKGSRAIQPQKPDFFPVIFPVDTVVK